MNRLRRAERWHHEERKKKTAEKRLKAQRREDNNYFPSYRDIGRRAATPKACSCWMCCNERRRKKRRELITGVDKFGKLHKIYRIVNTSEKDRLTKQEKKHMLEFTEQLNELGE